MSGTDMLDQPVYELELSVRAANAIERPFSWNGEPLPPVATTIRELVAMSAQELMRIPNFGKVSLKYVRQALAQHGLYLRGEGPPPEAKPGQPLVKQRRIVQIAVAPQPEGGISDTVYALADDGTVWSILPDTIAQEVRWKPLPPLP